MESMGATISTAVVTVSDGVARGTRVDESGELAGSILRASGFEVATRLVVPDERDDIEDTLRDLAPSHGLIVTTGGTGFGPRDVTPEATRAVLEKELPGFGEMMRMQSFAKVRTAILSRATAGTRGKSLIVNLPGKPSAVRECLEILAPAIREGVAHLRGEDPHQQQTQQ